MKTRSRLAPPVLAAVALLAAAPAFAAVQTYTSEAAFVLASTPLDLESFESITPVALATGAAGVVNAAGFSVTPQGTATLGVQDGPLNPVNGNGASATDGTHYLLSYQPNVATGTLRFVFDHAITAFGLNVIDVGEADGVVRLATDTGETSGGYDALSFPPQFGNGQVFFVGFRQDTPFTEVSLTVTGIDDSFGLDKVYSAAARVSTPGTLALAVLGLGLAGSLRQRRR